MGKYLNESKIDQPIPDLEGDSDLKDRMDLYVAINDALMLSVDEIDPDWLDKLSPKQKAMVDKYKELNRGDGLVESLNELDLETE